MVISLIPKNIDLLTYVCENGLHLLSLPPHTSHKLQPLDCSIFKALKVAYITACCEWLHKHPAQRITVYEIGELFQIAYFKVANIENAIAGFRTSGIHPFNSSVLPDSDFLEDPRESVDTSPTTSITPSVNCSQNHPSTSASTDANQLVSNTASTKDSLSTPATHQPTGWSRKNIQ